MFVCVLASISHELHGGVSSVGRRRAELVIGAAPRRVVSATSSRRARDAVGDQVRDAAQGFHTAELSLDQRHASDDRLAKHAQVGIAD